MQSSFPGFPIIKQSIINSKANMIILSEANIAEENIKNINGEFPDFDIHRKYIPGSKLSRIAVMTKNQGLNIQRMESIEDPSTACIWFKMRLAEKTIMIAAWYRQWNQLADVAQNYTDGVEGQVERIKLVKNQVEKAKAISKHIILMGDINIDMSYVYVSH